MELTPEQQQLVELATRVPLSDIRTARRVLEALIVDPLWLALESAPYDDEAVTPEDETALAEAEVAFSQGKITPHEEILREFGIE
ncbi:MAG: hypothetical protein ABSF22_04610 [Bryobacteraceae bacterium]